MDIIIWRDLAHRRLRRQRIYGEKWVSMREVPQGSSNMGRIGEDMDAVGHIAEDHPDRWLGDMTKGLGPYPCGSWLSMCSPSPEPDFLTPPAVLPICSKEEVAKCA